jgi:hypothetical protein
MLLTILISLAIIWLLVAAVVIAVCRVAAEAAEADAPDAPDAPDQRPRRPSTWGTVRSRILTSPHSDQLATYR